MKEHGTDEIQSENTDNKKIIFCLVFSIVASVSYVVCDLYKLPLFTFYPAVNEFAFGFAKMTESQGPAMYWYGWIGTSALFASAVALLITSFEASKKSVPFLSHLSWAAVWGLLPVLIHSLKYYWTHA